MPAGRRLYIGVVSSASSQRLLSTLCRCKQGSGHVQVAVRVHPAHLGCSQRQRGYHTQVHTDSLLS